MAEHLITDEAGCTNLKYWGQSVFWFTSVFGPDFVRRSSLFGQWRGGPNMTENCAGN